MRPAIVLLELDSIALGIKTGDAMVKRAPLLTLHAGSVQPGKYLILAGGEVGDVEEALRAGQETGGGSLADLVFLPDVHPKVVEALTGKRRVAVDDALGIVETKTVAATIGAADAGLKGASVELLEIHLADGLGGKAYTLFSGAVSDVEAAVEAAVESLHSPDQLVAQVVIPRLHAEMSENLRADPRFAPRARSYREES